ncbi:restriction endonuclease subunit S [Mycoplasmopsis bovis]|uniref:restriction endonuclease subunit S n=2 Tax=Mycoplasmopsis bovis TaxID=28903 RepID=UPI001BDF4F44|nr:restriction endonuclease subunit S [Mycoplasmopsis bovis]MBT1355993.1 restriction endonuclease subunit S [Mycoplasmopsis bovis]MBT1392539.1 restriction endonuclease subunit S [Mycoplasmopsis bovis]
MSNKLLVPRIRFKEFTNAWEQEKLGECSKFYNGLTSVSKSDFGVGKDLYIDYLNVFNNTFSQFSELKKFKNSSRQNYVQFKDVILTISSETPDEVAMSSVINWKNDYKNVAFNSFCILVRFNQLEKYDVNYIGYFFRSNSFRTQAMLMAQGISRFNINQTALKKTLFLFPPNIYEQQKIGNVLYYLDSLITLHQRKLLSLKNLKSRLLDRMFCDEKSQFPSIRFKEFTNAWEQDTAKNLFIPYRVKNSNNMNLVSYSVTNKDGFVNQNEYFDDGGKAVFADKKNSLIVSRNTFAYNPSRINVGSLALYKHSEMGLVSPIYEVFQINSNNNPDFFLLWFRSEAFKNIVSTNSNKSVRDTLNLSQFESESVNFPNFAEQLKISSLFTYLDSLITLHQRKLNSLKNIKNTLLDKMFV